MNNLQILAISGSLRNTSSNLLNSLREILLTMSAQIIEPANLTLNLAGRGLDAAGIIADKELSASLNKAIALFAAAIST